MGLFTKGLSAWVLSRLDPCPNEQNRTEVIKAVRTLYVSIFYSCLIYDQLKQAVSDKI